MESDSRGPIRIGLVGIGRAGLGVHLPELANYPKLFKVVAVCDPAKERRDMAVKQLGCREYRAYEDLLADSEVELVDIATRSDGHFDHALAALKTKCWVLLETPMATSLEEALKLRAAAVKAGNRLFIRHNQRFSPEFHQIQKVISSGVLGKIYDIRLRAGSYNRRDDWQAVRRCGGGRLLNQGPDLIDQALLLLSTPPIQIFSNIQRVAAVGDAEDYARIIMRNNAGLSIDLEISDGRIIPEPAYLVTGTRGSLSIMDKSMRLRFLDPDQKLKRRRASVRAPHLDSFGTPESLPWIEKETEIVDSKEASPHILWKYLHDSIRRNKGFPITLDQAVDTMRIIDAARKDTAFE